VLNVKNENQHTSLLAFGNRNITTQRINHSAKLSPCPSAYRHKPLDESDICTWRKYLSGDLGL